MPWPTIKSLRFTQYPGFPRLRFQMTPRDCPGNIGAAAEGPGFSTHAAPETGARYAGGWQTGNSATARGGHTRYSSNPKATATFSFTGREIALFAPKSARRGAARISVDGHYVATISEYAKTTTPRVVVFRHIVREDRGAPDHDPPGRHSGTAAHRHRRLPVHRPAGSAAGHGRAGARPGRRPAGRPAAVRPQARTRPVGFPHAPGMRDRARRGRRRRPAGRRRFGTAGSNTLAHVAEAVGGLDLPNLQSLGLGNVLPLEGCPPRPGAPSVWGRLAERSAGMDTTTGHWEMMGIVLERPFPTFPDGFPDDVIDAFSAATGRGVLGNVAASGTEIIQELGDEHRRTGSWIVYTSADSVFQIAAHEDVVPVEELYAACRIARGQLQGRARGRQGDRPAVRGRAR